MEEEGTEGGKPPGTGESPGRTPLPQKGTVGVGSQGLPTLRRELLKPRGTT